MKEFPPFVLDAANQCLWKQVPGGGDLRVVLAPKAYAVLEYLVARAGQLITHQDFLDTLWPGVYVQPEVLKAQILSVREALQDEPKNPRFIETLPRRGYRFIAPVTERGTPRPSKASANLRIVGRERALEEMRRVREGAFQQRQVQTLFVTGDAGIGKTSLVDEFVRETQAAVPEALVARGQCIEGYGGKEAYYPMLEALQELIASSFGQSVARALAGVAPTWLAQFPGLAIRDQRASLAHEILGTTPQRMLREIRTLLKRISDSTPLLLVFEDLQWTDGSTVDLISAFARSRESSRLMLIGTYRTFDVMTEEHPIGRLKRELALHRLCNEVALERLREVDVVRYLAGQGGDAPDGLADLIYRHTEGNPLFMTAALEHFCQRGLLSKKGDQWALQVPLGEIAFEVPETLREMIEARLARLSAEEQRALEIASVAGATFAAQLCADTAGLDLERMQELCSSLARRRFIIGNAQQTPAWLAGESFSCFEFVHSMYREVLYRRQGPTRRRALHNKLARQLADTSTEHVSDLAPVLAHHFELGGEWLLAAQYLKTVAEVAAGQLALPVAEEALHHALKLIERLPLEQRGFEVEILETLAKLYSRTYDPRALATYDLLIESARNHGRLDVEIQAWIGRALPIAQSGTTLQYIESVDRALELSQRLAPPDRERTRLQCLLWRSGAAWNFEQEREIRTKYDEIRTTYDARAQTDLLLSCAFFLANRSEYRESIRAATDGVELLIQQEWHAKRIPLHELYFTSRVAIWRAMTMLGQWGEVLDHVATAITDLQRDGQAAIAKFLGFKAKSIYARAMHYQGVLSLFRPPRDASLREFRVPRVDRMFESIALMGVGELDRGLQLAEQVQNEMITHPRMDDWLSRLPLELALVDAQLQRRDLEVAQREADKFLNSALATSERTWKGLAWEACARVAAAIGDLPRAVECITQAQQCVEGLEVPLAQWPIDAMRGWLCEQQQDASGAHAHYASSARIVRRLAASLSGHPEVQAAFLSAPPVKTLLGTAAAQQNPEPDATLELQR